MDIYELAGTNLGALTVRPMAAIET
jgi:hypothetical protein